VNPEQFLQFFDKRVGDLVLSLGHLDKTLQKLIVILEKHEPWRAP